MKPFSAIPRRRIFEALLLLLLTALAWRAGSQRLHGWSGPAGSLTNDLFIPAVMMNAGHGFSNIDPLHIPELRSFLDFQTQSFDVALIPDDVELLPLHPYQEFHRYLVYSAAATWRIFGLRWDAMKILVLVYFLLSCVAVYSLSRLGMNVLFSFLVAAAFAHSRPVLWTLPLLRDFAKAPFIIATALLLGIMVSRELSRRRLYLTAVATGLLLGVGLGIRRDMMVFLPISVMLVFVGTVRGARYAVATKLVAAALLVITFLIAGWPIHRALAREGYLAAHDTIMGFSSYSDHELGVLNPASYEKNYALNDVYSTLQAHYGSVLGAAPVEQPYSIYADAPHYDQKMKRAYAQTIMKTFPADMLSRAYAAVLRIASGIVAAPGSPERYGVWFVAAGLLMVASVHPVRAWLLLAMLCYFCGYTSLQFAIRHAFHTSFVPFFFMGFVAHHGGRHITGATINMFRPKRHVLRLFGCGRLRLLCIRLACWSVITAAAFAIPLQVALLWQANNVAALRHHYENASVTPVEHTTLMWDGRVLFAPMETIAAEKIEDAGLLANFNSGVLIAAFSNVSVPLDLRAVFEWDGNTGDFGGPINVSLSLDGPPEKARLYFPVHEQAVDGGEHWSRFVGLSMSEGTAALFDGFYRADDLRDFSLLINMLLPETDERFLPAQQVSVPWTGKDWAPYYPYGAAYDLPVFAQTIKALLATSRPEHAVNEAAAALERYPGSLLITLLLAEALEQTERQQQAYEQCLSLLAMFPELPVVYEQVDIFFDKHGGADGRHNAWSKVIEDNPTLQKARAYLVRAEQDLAAATQDFNQDASHE